MIKIKVCLLNKAYYLLCLIKIYRVYQSHAERAQFRRRKERQHKERGGTVGRPVVLSPSGTRRNHDGRRRGRIFHCQSPGGTVIHFFFSLISASTLSLWFCVSVKCQFNGNTQVLSDQFRQKPHTETKKICRRTSLTLNASFHIHSCWTPLHPNLHPPWPW